MAKRRRESGDGSEEVYCLLNFTRFSESKNAFYVVKNPSELVLSQLRELSGKYVGDVSDKQENAMNSILAKIGEIDGEYYEENCTKEAEKFEEIYGIWDECSLRELNREYIGKVSEIFCIIDE
jgi:hypothetical protein